MKPFRSLERGKLGWISLWARALWRAYIWKSSLQTAMTSKDTITTQSHWKTASFSCLALWVTSHEGQKSPMKRNTAPCLTYLTQHEIFPSASTLMQMKCFFFFFFYIWTQKDKYLMFRLLWELRLRKEIQNQKAQQRNACVLMIVENIGLPNF